MALIVIAELGDRSVPHVTRASQTGNEDHRLSMTHDLHLERIARLSTPCPTSYQKARQGQQHDVFHRSSIHYQRLSDGVAFKDPSRLLQAAFFRSRVTSRRCIERLPSTWERLPAGSPSASGGTARSPSKCSNRCPTSRS